MAENSTLSFTTFAMDGEDFIMFLLLTTVAVSYLLLERKYFLKLWSKCKSSILEFYNCKPVLQDQPARLSLLSIVDWQYRGEGNEYLAISLPEKRKILRLRKSAKPVGLLAKLKDWYCQNVQLNITEETKATSFEKLNLEYYKILTSLIGECYVQPAEDVLLFHKEIKKINAMISSKRPEHRKKKRIGSTCGSLLTDYAYLPADWEISQFEGPTFAVEIKPKQGWIPAAERIYLLCTYCHNQYIKLENGETSGISDYCPMDLFSGDLLRMKYAVKCLLKTPQNNLKIFREGMLVYGENLVKTADVLSSLFGTTESKSADEFCDLLTKALLKQLYAVNPHSCKSKHAINVAVKNGISHFGCHKICNFSRNELPVGCVLDRILNLQELDEWGSKAICTYGNKSLLHESPYGYIKHVVAKAKNSSNSLNCAKCFFNDPTKNDVTQIIATNIQRYMMSAIAKDCSLMLTFRKLKTGFEIKVPAKSVIQTDSGLYLFKIGVFDLYPKPLTCIYKHCNKRDRFLKMYKCILNGHYSNVLKSHNIYT